MPEPVDDADQRQVSHVAPWWLLTGAGVISQLLTTVSGVLAARMLGVEGRGQVVLVATLAGMASQLSLGGSLPNAISKQLSQRGVTARDGLRGLARRWMLLALVPASLAGGYALVLGWDDDWSTKYGLAFAVMVMAILAMASRILMGSMLGERTNPVQIALTGILPQAVVVLVVAAAMVGGIRWNALELLTVTMLCTGLVLVARLRVLARPTGRPEDELDRKELHALARRTHVGSVGPIDGLGLDRFLVGSLLGSVQLGLYSVAFALGGLTNMFAVCLAMVSLPHVAALQPNRRAEAKFVRRWLLMSGGLLAATVVVIELVMVPVIRLTFGADFLGATESARWVVLASGFLGFRRVLIAILQGRDRGALASITEFALTPFVVLGIVVSAWVDRLVGVGITLTVVGLVSCLVLGIAVARTSATGVSAPARKTEIVS